MASAIAQNGFSVADEAKKFSSTSRAALNKSIRSGGTEQEMRKAAAEFASVFITQMLSVMNDTVVKGELGHGGKGEETFQSMINEQYARQIAYQDSTGLTEMVYQALKKKTEETVTPAQVAAGVAKAPDNQPTAEELAVKAEKMARASRAAHAYQNASVKSW